MGKRKGPRKLERHFKGVANHRRIQILLLVAAKPKISVMDIADELKCNFKTIAEHTRRLALAGLVEKTNFGNTVEHRLTPYGRRFVSFIDDFSRIAETDA